MNFFRIIALFFFVAIASVVTAFGQDAPKVEEAAISTRGPEYPPRTWLVTYGIESGWGSRLAIGIVEVKSYWGYPGQPKDQLFKDLISELTKRGILDDVKGLGEYREDKNGNRVYRANVYLLNRDWFDIFGPDGYKFNYRTGDLPTDE